MSRILVIRNDELDPHVSVADCIPPVEQSFAALTEGRAQLPTKYHDRTDVGMWFFMGGHMGTENAMAVKLGCATANTLFCQVIHYDAQTAEPLALMEGLRVTYLRTGAAAAIGAKHMARPDSAGVAILGTGRVGWNSLVALDQCFSLQQAYAADIDEDAARDFATYGELVEHEAMEVQAIMMSGRPSALYLQPATVGLIHALRAWRDEGLPVYFTLDAGPNLHVLCEGDRAPEVVSRLRRVAPRAELIHNRPGAAAELVDEHLF